MYSSFAFKLYSWQIKNRLSKVFDVNNTTLKWGRNNHYLIYFKLAILFAFHIVSFLHFKHRWVSDEFSFLKASLAMDLLVDAIVRKKIYRNILFGIYLLHNLHEIYWYISLLF